MSNPSILTPPSKSRALAWSLLLALGLRTLLPVCVWLVTGEERSFLMPDSFTYLAAAQELARTGLYEVGGFPELLRPPGYPLLLLPGVFLGAPVLVTIILQIAASLACVLLAHRLGRLLFEREDVARCGALLLAVEPLSILYASKLLSETLATLALLGFLWSLLRYLRDGRPVALGLAALSLAAAALCRPIFYYLPALVGVALLWRAWRSPHSRRPLLLHAALFLALAMAPLATWQARNDARADYPKFTSFEAHNVYFVAAAALRARAEHRNYWDVRQALGADDLKTFFRRSRETRGLNEAETLKRMSEEGWDAILAAPWTYAWLHLQGIARMLLDPGAAELHRMFGDYPRAAGLLRDVEQHGLWGSLARLARERPLLVVSNVVLGLWLLGVLTLALLGAWRSRLWTRTGGWLVLLVLGYLILFSGGPVTTHRFRHPLMPLFCTLAAAGLLLRRRERT